MWLKNWAGQVDFSFEVQLIVYKKSILQLQHSAFGFNYKKHLAAFRSCNSLVYVDVPMRISC